MDFLKNALLFQLLSQRYNEGLGLQRARRIGLQRTSYMLQFYADTQTNKGFCHSKITLFPCLFHAFLQDAQVNQSQRAIGGALDFLLPHPFGFTVKQETMAENETEGHVSNMKMVCNFQNQQGTYKKLYAKSAEMRFSKIARTQIKSRSKGYFGLNGVSCGFTIQQLAK